MNSLKQRLPRFSVLLVSLICSSALLLAGALEVRAAKTITIEKPDTRQNGGEALTPRGGDTITVTKTGSITISGGASSIGGSPAILATDRNTISNAGKINTRGGARSASRPAISVADGNTISNTGEIDTTGPAAHGIDVNNNNEITNSGSISTAGLGAFGIYAENNNKKITNSGSISTKGNGGAHGIFVGSNNIITNSGSISTEGGIGYGIQVDDNNEITNNVSINTKGDDARGINADEDNTIINSGSINTEGDRAEGIFANYNNAITNEAGASILTIGEGAAGIRMNRFNPFGPRDKITNHGLIETSGAAAAGIDVSKDSRVINTDFIAVTNTNRITTTGPNAHGIQVSDKTKITHSGRIQVSGPGSAGILALNGNELTLSGAIISTQDSALHLGDNNTINHSGNDTLRSTGQNTPAVRLGNGNTLDNTGRIEATGQNAPAVMMGDGNTLTNTGRIEATGQGRSAHGITGGSNNIINNSGTISARGGRAICFAGRNNTINLLSGSVLIGGLCPGARVNMTVDTAPANSILWDGILARPKRGSGAPFFYNAQNLRLATYDTRALAASAGALGDASGNVSRLMARPALRPSGNTRSLIPTASGSALWLHSSGSRAQYQGRGGLNPEFGHLALAAGYDLRLHATQFGLLAGYGQGELRLEGEQRFKPGPSLFKGPLAAFYVRQDFAPFSVQLGLSGGVLRHESSRLVNDNRAPDGLARAEARTRSWWLAPEARIGLRLDAGLMQFEPAFTARYARQSIQGFTETGIRAPATVGRRKVELVETRLELKVRREMGLGRIAWKAGWQYRNDLNSIQAEVRLLGESQRVRLESGLGSNFYLGAEAEFELAPGLFLNLNGEAVSSARGWLPSGMASVYRAF